MAKRKTVEVSALKDQINFMLANSRCPVEGRKSMMVILENVLMETGNYRGFSYLSKNEVPEGYQYGINLEAYGECDTPTSSMLFDNTDSTRVCYN